MSVSKNVNYLPRKYDLSILKYGFFKEDYIYMLRNYLKQIKTQKTRKIEYLQSLETSSNREFYFQVDKGSNMQPKRKETYAKQSRKLTTTSSRTFPALSSVLSPSVSSDTDGKVISTLNLFH